MTRGRRRPPLEWIEGALEKLGVAKNLLYPGGLARDVSSEEVGEIANRIGEAELMLKVAVREAELDATIRGRIRDGGLVVLRGMELLGDDGA